MASCGQMGDAGNKELTTKVDSVSYALGVDIAVNIDRSLQMFETEETKIDKDVLIHAFAKKLKEEDTKITAEETTAIIRSFMEEQRSVQEKERQEKAVKSLEEGKKFLEENAKKDGIQTTASGLQYQVLKAGEGVKPAATDRVKVHYTGKTIDGKVFDSSVERGEPATFGVNQVIKGWTEALQLMPVGSKYKLFIPSEIAYGERGAGADIAPNSVLIFEVELLEIVKPAAAK
ncbi:FKBP-type peptidyl-prolyl cis-trans isomerase [Puteibacter caeruleilacunae]|nr:FKBP-type peptidyl-prolyl cis-trans isomerase [Puteibacter caeruleilacunae]